MRVSLHFVRSHVSKAVYLLLALIAIMLFVPLAVQLSVARHIYTSAESNWGQPPLWSTDRQAEKGWLTSFLTPFTIYDPDPIYDPIYYCRTAILGKLSRQFLESYHDSFSHYRKLKRYAGNRWDQTLERIIKALRSGSSKWSDTHKLADVYVEEGIWDELLALVQKNPEYVQSYGKRLEKRFPQEVGRMYLKLAQKDMESAGGRGAYQEKCRLLKEAKRLGCEREVEKLIVEWRKKYDRRRALLEELARV